MSDRGDARLVWVRHGLASPSRRAALVSAGSIRTRAEGFKSACVELGGYCQAFAVFLSGRADLLPFAYLEELESVPVPFLGDPTRNLPPMGSAELEELESGLYTRVFRGRLDGRPAVVEHFRVPEDSVRRAAWQSFERTIAPLAGFPESAILTDDVLSEFHRWLDIHTDLQTKRRMLENLSEAPVGSLTLIPNLIPDFRSEELLAYEDLELICGVSQDVARRGPLFLEAVLEQILILAFVAVDEPWKEARLLDDNRVGYRIWPFLEAIPVQHYQPVLQYVASSMAEDGGRAMRMLLKIIRYEDGEVLESDLWRQLSGLRFEVAADHRVSRSCEKMIEFWKALTAEHVRRPRFLDFLHRKLVLTLRSAYDPDMDWAVPSASAVFSRLVNARFAEVTNLDRAREWAVGSGLVALSTARQAGAFLEQLRENDFSITVKTDSGQAGRLRRRPSLRVAISALLFIAGLQGALLLSGTLLGHLSILVCLLFGAVFFVAASHGD
jgi:hypothetical protein